MNVGVNIYLSILRLCDVDNNAFFSITDISQTLDSLGINVEDWGVEADDLVAFCKSKKANPNDRRRHINLADYIDIFQNVKIEDTVLLGFVKMLQGVSFHGFKALAT